MLRLIEPFAKDAQAMRADDLRNLLIISGTERELRHLMDTIALFDVDWMAGMSAGHLHAAERRREVRSARRSRSCSASATRTRSAA